MIVDTVDNWGTQEFTTKEDEIIKILKDSDSWTDDLEFHDYSKNIYSIDDLIGKRVSVGSVELLVTEDGAEEREADIDEHITGEWKLIPVDESADEEVDQKILEEIHRIIDPVLKLKETLKELVTKYPDDRQLGESVRRLKLD